MLSRIAAAGLLLSIAAGCGLQGTAPIDGVPVASP
jgi:hypothetical protein